MRTSFLFVLCALVLSACDPGEGPGGLVDVRESVAGAYESEVVDSEYTCPPGQYLPAASDWMMVYLAAVDEENTVFDIFFQIVNSDTGSWTLNTHSVPFLASGDFFTSFPLTLLDGTPSDVTMSGTAGNGELSAMYLVVVHAPAADCRISATVRGLRRDD